MSMSTPILSHRALAVVTGAGAQVADGCLLCLSFYFWSGGASHRSLATLPRLAWQRVTCHDSRDTDCSLGHGSVVPPLLVMTVYRLFQNQDGHTLDKVCIALYGWTFHFHKKNESSHISKVWTILMTHTDGSSFSSFQLSVTMNTTIMNDPVVHSLLTLTPSSFNTSL